jgi:hypothetical protein
MVFPCAMQAKSLSTLSPSAQTLPETVYPVKTWSGICRSHPALSHNGSAQACAQCPGLLWDEIWFLTPPFPCSRGGAGSSLPSVRLPGFPAWLILKFLGAHLGEKQHFLNALLVGEHHGQTVYTHTQSAGGRHGIFQ